MDRRNVCTRKHVPKEGQNWMCWFFSWPPGPVQWMDEWGEIRWPFLRLSNEVFSLKSNSSSPGFFVILFHVGTPGGARMASREPQEKEEWTGYVYEDVSTLLRLSLSFSFRGPLMFLTFWIPSYSRSFILMSCAWHTLCGSTPGCHLRSVSPSLSVSLLLSLRTDSSTRRSCCA